ncbi:hypothetical protein O1611_g3050 [Lasiodiplodia mahajangana]|uniref:Uncharacterized protein n=1 Tax=Lasiodiplodia mahajangana TaxID=1108764 RepID=A0ACC2JSU8_9PEZI|nr:hypothetical protein O1611_g3050 [Lasiodiplodia mahajangana]
MIYKSLKKVDNEPFSQERLFQDEPDKLLDYLQLSQGPSFHHLGQSWGGMLCVAFAARRTEGLWRLVLASGLVSKELADGGIDQLGDRMSQEMRQALDESD